jgi:hypothetical protein
MSDETTTETAETGDDGMFDLYAAYDKRMRRYVGGAHTTKSAARDAAKDRGVESRDIRVDKV